MKDKLWWGLFSIGAVLMIHNAIAGEWNEKPVMCEQKEIALNTVRSKGELPLMTGVQSTKVRDTDGLSDVPAHTALQIFVNHQTKTFSILEYHPSYNSICPLQRRAR